MFSQMELQICYLKTRSAQMMSLETRYVVSVSFAILTLRSVLFANALMSLVLSCLCGKTKGLIDRIQLGRSTS